jgi:hypothetical protein
VADPEKSIQLLVGDDRAPWPLTLTSAGPAKPAPEELERPGKDLVASRRTTVTLALGKPLPLDTGAWLVIAPTLAGREGPLTLEKEIRIPFRTYGPLRFGTMKACSGDEGCSYGR